MNLNNSELATVLAALRCYQRDRNMGMQDTADYFQDADELTDEQIDDLCERINCTAEKTPATDELKEAACQLYASDDIQISDSALMSEADGGTWVAAWVWVPDAP